MEIHSSEWFTKLRGVNPQQAAMTAHIVQLAGRKDICSICGDTNSKPYRSVAEPDLTLRLCDDCKGIQKTMYGSSFDPI